MLRHLLLGLIAGSQAFSYLDKAYFDTVVDLKKIATINSIAVSKNHKATEEFMDAKKNLGETLDKFQTTQYSATDLLKFENYWNEFYKTCIETSSYALDKRSDKNRRKLEAQVDNLAVQNTRVQKQIQILSKNLKKKKKEFGVPEKVIKKIVETSFEELSSENYDSHTDRESQLLRYENLSELSIDDSDENLILGMEQDRKKTSLSCKHSFEEYDVYKYVETACLVEDLEGSDYEDKVVINKKKSRSHSIPPLDVDKANLEERIWLKDIHEKHKNNGRVFLTAKRKQ